MSRPLISLIFFAPLCVSDMPDMPAPRLAPHVCAHISSTSQRVFSPPSLAPAAFPPTSSLRSSNYWLRSPLERSLFSFPTRLPPHAKMHGWHATFAIVYQISRVHIRLVAEALPDLLLPSGQCIATPNCGSSPPPLIQCSWQSAYSSSLALCPTFSRPYLRIGPLFCLHSQATTRHMPFLWAI